jgi:hypothetical protein
MKCQPLMESHAALQELLWIETVFLCVKQVDMSEENRYIVEFSYVEP